MNVTHSLRPPRRALAVLAVVYLALALTYAWAMPLFESSDETWHFWYVKHLADGKGLAVVTPDERPLWRQEGTQPPLYYLLAAALVRPVDTSDAERVIIRNPFITAGRADLPGNRNTTLPVSRDPLRGTALAAQTARWFSVALGLVTVLATYALAREIVPDSPVVWLGAAALVALNPQFLSLSGSVNNDNMIVAVATLALWRLTHWLRQPPNWRGLLLLGALGGLAALSKLSGLALLGFIGLVVGLRGLYRRSWRAALGWGATVGVTALLVAGWFYARNAQLYGDPLALEIHLELSGRRNPPPSLWQVLGELESVRRSFWAVFGWFNVVAPDWLYLLFDALTLLAVVGVAVGVWRAWRGANAVLPWLGLLGAWLAVVLVSLLRWMSLIKAAQGRLLFPALGAVAVLTAWGLAQLAPRRPHVILGPVVLFLALTAALLPPLVIAPAYAPPRPLPPDQATIPYPVQADFGGQMRLLGYDLGPQARPGELAPITLYWQALQPLAADYVVFVQLVGTEKEGAGRVAGLDTHPGLGSFPTSDWPAGLVIPDPLYIPVGPAVAAPRSYPVIVGLVDPATGRRLPVTREGRPAGDAVALGSLFVRPTDPAWRPAQTADAMFGLGARLVGYDLSAVSARPGETVTLALLWQARQPLDADYTVFVHLGERDPLAAQADGPPLAGRAPTSGWRAEQWVYERRELTIRPDAAPGDYPLGVGLYLPATGARLPLREGGTDDTAVLGQIRVEVR